MTRSFVSYRPVSASCRRDGLPLTALASGLHAEATLDRLDGHSPSRGLPATGPRVPLWIEELPSQQSSPGGRSGDRAAVCRRRSWSNRSGTVKAGRRCPRLALTWVSVSVASIVVAFSGAVRLGGLRSRACRCSRGHRPSGCGSEARGRRATLPQRRRRGVGGSLTRTPLQRAYRLQRPCHIPIVRAYFGSA